MLKNMPDFKLHTQLKYFFMDPTVPMWLKLIHLFILIDSKAQARNGYTIWYQNTGLMKKFSLYAPNGDLIWKPSRRNVQLSIQILEDMGLIERTVSSNGERRIKLNRSFVIQYLREHNLDSDSYKNLRIKSRQRKLIRRKIITVAEFVNSKRSHQNEQFKRYVEFQHRKYGYEIDLPDIELFEVDYDQFVTPAELEFFKEHLRQHKMLDALMEQLPNVAV